MIQIQLKQLNTGDLSQYILDLLTLNGSIVSYSIPISSGAKNTFVSFPSPLTGVPSVQTTVTIPTTGSLGILASPSNVTASGFYANYSAAIPNNGYLLTYSF